jgi:hypothetical protein
MTIGRLTLALALALAVAVAVAVAVFRDQPQNFLEHLPLNGDLGHLEGDLASVAHQLRADLDQLPQGTL